MIPLLLATLAWPVLAPPPDRPSPPPCICVCQNAVAPAAPGSAPPNAAPTEPEPTVPRIAAPEPTVEIPSAPDHWYGGPAVASDIASFALVGMGGAWNSGEVFLLGVAGFGVGAPINHLANGHPQRALASLGIRLLGFGVATGALLLDVVAHPCDGEPSCEHSPVLGLTAGAAALLAAMALDDALLAREPVPATGHGASLAPAVVVGPNLAFVSLGGAF